jgi:hypothetical protein
LECRFNGNNLTDLELVRGHLTWPFGKVFRRALDARAAS